MKVSRENFVNGQSQSTLIASVYESATFVNLTQSGQVEEYRQADRQLLLLRETRVYYQLGGHPLKAKLVNWKRRMEI